MLLLTVLGSCRTNRIISETTVTKRDSITTITERPVAIHVPADSLMDSLAFSGFQHLFTVASVGSVIRQATSPTGKLAYTIRKISHGDFAVEVETQGHDARVTVTDTHTRVTEKTKTSQVRQVQPTKFAQVMITVKSYFVWLLAFFVLAVGLRVWWLTREPRS